MIFLLLQPEQTETLCSTCLLMLGSKPRNSLCVECVTFMGKARELTETLTIHKVAHVTSTCNLLTEPSHTAKPKVRQGAWEVTPSLLHGTLPVKWYEKDGYVQSSHRKETSSE